MYNKQSWKYYGAVKQHVVEMIHHLNHERLLLRLNGTIIIDETISTATTNKVISFFVDGELCVVNVDKINNKYSYNFITPEYSTSKKGIKRKTRHRLMIAGFAALFLLIFVGLGSGILYQIIRHEHQKYNNSLGGIVAKASINRIVYNPNEKAYSIYYQYQVNGTKFNAQQQLEKKYPKAYTPFHMPINTNDEFDVIYTPMNPESSRLLLDRPSPQQIERYRNMAREACISSAEHNEQWCDCTALYLFFHFKEEGYARLYHINNTNKKLPYHQGNFTSFINSNKFSSTFTNCDKFLE